MGARPVRGAAMDALVEVFKAPFVAADPPPLAQGQPQGPGVLAVSSAPPMVVPPASEDRAAVSAERNVRAFAHDA